MKIVDYLVRYVDFFTSGYVDFFTSLYIKKYSDLRILRAKRNKFLGKTMQKTFKPYRLLLIPIDLFPYRNSYHF